jgi:ADP-heptose:LPS heptosyltransferase
MLKLKNFQKILIIRPDRIGDLTLSLATPVAIKTYCPQTKIYYLVSGYAAPLLHYSNHVDGSLLYTEQDGQPKSVAGLIEIMAEAEFDLAIFLKSNWRTAFASFLAGIPVRIGTARRAYSFLFNEMVNISRKKSDLHEIDLNLCLLKPLGIEIDPGIFNPVLDIRGRIWPDRQKYNLPENYLIIHLGSRGSAPNWPLDNYLELASWLAQKNPVVITGQIKTNVQLPIEAINLLNRTGLDDLVHIISKAKLLISGGTGPLHLADALGVPVLGFFPNSHHLGPKRWGPRGPKTMALTPPEQTGHRCRKRDDGSCVCMDAIKVESIEQIAMELLQ